MFVSCVVCVCHFLKSRSGKRLLVCVFFERRFGEVFSRISSECNISREELCESGSEGIWPTPTSYPCKICVEDRQRPSLHSFGLGTCLLVRFCINDILFYLTIKNKRKICSSTQNFICPYFMENLPFSLMLLEFRFHAIMSELKRNGERKMPFILTG